MWKLAIRKVVIKCCWAKTKEKSRQVTIGQLATREVLTQVPEENKTLVTRNT
jgi:hypothetical protein